MLSMRFVFRALGLVLVAAALAFVGLQIAAYTQDLGNAAGEWHTWRTVGLGAALYGMLSILLAVAWQWIVGRADAGARVTFSDAFEVYGRSQIAKYVPGNVFHFFGRQLLGRDVGWAQGAIAVASIVETLCLGSAAATLLFLLSLVGHEALLRHPPSWVLGLGAAVAIVGPSLLLRYGRHLPVVRDLGFIVHADRLGRGLALFPPFAIHAVFFMATGLVFWFLVSSAFGFVSPGLIPGIAVAFVSGWLLGNLTPSAPGGIGVREAIMLPQLAVLIGDSRAIVVVVMFRLVTIGGDLLFLAVASWLNYRRRAALAA
jgi:hypothetical protein